VAKLPDGRIYSINGLVRIKLRNTFLAETRGKIFGAQIISQANNHSIITFRCIGVLRFK
jgi:hypothetical protein